MRCDERNVEYKFSGNGDWEAGCVVKYCGSLIDSIENGENEPMVQQEVQSGRVFGNKTDV
jgi:hypothetical protein